MFLTRIFGAYNSQRVTKLMKWPVRPANTDKGLLWTHEETCRIGKLSGSCRFSYTRRNNRLVHAGYFGLTGLLFRLTNAFSLCIFNFVGMHQHKCFFLINWAATRKNLTLLHANNKGVNQPAHPRSMISAFVMPSLPSIIISLDTCKAKKNLPGNLRS